MSGDGIGAAIQGVSTLIGAAVSGYSAISSASNKPKTPKAPVITPPTVMPVADDAAITAAQREAIIRRQQAGGRASTNLVDDALGG